MARLEAGNEAIWSETFRKYAAYHIVDFVPYNIYKNDPAMLAKRVLFELPGGLVDYFRIRGIVPNAKNEAEREIIAHKMTNRITL